MNKYQLYRAIRRHRKLAERRNINYEQNKSAKFIVWFMGTFLLLYLIFFAVMLSLIANDSRSTTTVEFIFALAPFILALDFFFRFTAQQTPSQLIKPYVLLPISRHTCIDNFIASSLFTSSNLIWFAMIVPYLIMSVVFSEGIIISLCILLLFWLLILANSQWYSIVRTLINDSLLWWLLPAGVYAVMALPWYVGPKHSIVKLLDTYATIGSAVSEHRIWPYALVLLILALVVAINRHVQYTHVMRELGKTEQTKLKHVSRFTFLERYGEIGQFLQLEIKMIIRNKNPKKAFIAATALVMGFSLVSALTDVYDGSYMVNFLGMYNFLVFGMMNLVHIMCHEGNYIDLLMVQKENILSLLRAKYFFYCGILLLPFLLMLVTVVMGKWSFFMLLSYAVFTAGFQYFCLFQLAVYNKQTVPLNTKFISKGGMESNYFQFAIQMFTLFIPTVLVSALQSLFSPNVAYTIILLIGLAFVATHHLWLRNIYNRMMKKRYTLLEAFQSTR